VDGYGSEPWNGVTDMTLSGDVLAVIEAKRTWRSPREGEEQLRYYVTETPSARRLDSPRAVAGGSGPELGKPSPGALSGRARACLQI
jgi:hypothetical protein